MHKRKAVSIVLAVVMLIFCFPVQTAMAEESGRTGHIVNCVSAVNVRSGPGTGYVKIGTAQKDAVYNILGETGSWYKILFNGRTGYVSASYFKVDSVALSADQAVSSQTGKIVNCASWVNVRSGPGTGYSKLGTAPKNAVYDVLAINGSWIKLSYNGAAGYV